MVKEYSTHEKTKTMDGDLGYFNPGGALPLVPASREFTEKACELEKGLNPPMHHAGKWHIIDILEIKPERPMTFNQARDQVEADMLPGYQDAIVKDYLASAREQYGVTIEGIFAPGEGLSPDQLMLQAMTTTDPTRALELYKIIFTDFPDAKEADNALFLAANTALDTFADRRIADRYLGMLLERYPDSELVEDAQYLRDNLGNPNLLSPESFEEQQQDQ
jgi:hypothetical protein